MTVFTRRSTLGLIAASGGVAACAVVADAKEGDTAATGSGHFLLDVPLLETGSPLRVWYHRPVSTGPDSQVVMVMHGQGRNADGYRDGWIPHAEALGLVIVAPEFDRGAFPGAREFNLGWMFDADGTPRARDRWSFSIVDLAFDAAAARFGSRRTTYGLFGHSAGGQFVHRFMLFMPTTRVERAISANSGWYTLPTLEQPFPYGAGGTTVTEADIAAYLGEPLVLLLGEADIDPAHSALNTDAEVMPQGPHRFARGQTFFAAGRREAERLGVPFGWTLQTVPGVAHSGSRMAGPAARLLKG
ncbi:MAG: hypothetical protein Q7U72_09365 [Brevundimonas sp.]|uniref:hypothetical protein n=1 Tax=Brevundimonas sp. TaxID=1871086 RepID=UPI00271DF51F|nr:hypothetical protein [Brevundimonas sp.]MDO9077642.1 hypothetical protein [Brevundimonas sp.]MDP3079503.1 hypothetical protein [Brevundimonas sp.]MDZ4060709.1 hypothetical protein [Brevundimonas sp.]